MLRSEPYKRVARCVHCGKLGVTVGEPCRYSKVGHQTMDLPDGKTCGDCVHIARCQAIFGHIPADESCDFFPSRFRAKEVTMVLPVTQPSQVEATAEEPEHNIAT